MFAFFSKSGLKKFVSEAGYEQIEITGRHIYLILAGRAALAIAPLLEKLGFQRELRFRTKTWFWFLGGFSSRASRWWTDTLIITAQKIER